MPPVIKNIVDLQNLSHRYGDRLALDGVSLQVGGGEIFGFLGPNGSGKTTLFRILSTLLRPQDGRVTIRGRDLSSERDAVRRQIGVVFQAPSLDKQLTAEENLLCQGHLYGMKGTELRDRAAELLRRVGLADRAHERVASFSGGMRRRVELAKGLLHRPALLLLDEPSTGLDPTARIDVWNLLEEIRKNDGVTVLLTTHLMDEADRCSRLAILSGGKLLACDTPANLKQRIGGDVITLATADAGALHACLRERLSIDASQINGTIRIEQPEAHQLIPRLVESCPGMIDSVSMGKPTLEDVFIQLTGHGFRDADRVTPEARAR